MLRVIYSLILCTTLPPFFSQQEEGKAPLGMMASCEMAYRQNYFPDISQQLICLLKHEI
jgi:hypothetical protein